MLGASGGIGGAVARALRADPRFDEVHTFSRRTDRLDLTDEASVARVANSFDGRELDLVFVATGALETAAGGPEKSFASLTFEAMQAAFAVNASGVALAIKHFAPLTPKDRRSAFAVLSARVGSIGDNRLGGWMSYRASKAALNQIVRCAAAEFARTRKHCVFASLHPGTIETDLTRKFARDRYTATPEACAASLLNVVESLESKQSGGFFAYDGSAIEW